jgi:hypothetical protein
MPNKQQPPADFDENPEWTEETNARSRPWGDWVWKAQIEGQLGDIIDALEAGESARALTTAKRALRELRNADH